MIKDWKGNGRTMTCLGVHNYSEHERESQDFYATNPKAIIKLLEVEDFNNSLLSFVCFRISIDFLLFIKSDWRKPCVTGLFYITEYDANIYS